MPTVETKNKPATKPSKISKTHKPTKAETERKTHLDFDKRIIGRKHHRWIKSNPSANFGDLLQYLEGVKKELEAFNDDDVDYNLIRAIVQYIQTEYRVSSFFVLDCIVINKF